MSRNSLKWLPAIIVPVVIVAGMIAVPLQAGAAVDLPDKTADEVLLLVSESTDAAFSGTVVKTADLGLPTMALSAGLSPSMVDSMSESVPEGMEDFVPGAASTGLVTSALELLGGTHEARVFADGPKNVRVQVKDRLAERNFVSNGADAWFYDSQTNVATHVSIPADAEAKARAEFAELDAAVGAELSNPAAVADRFLAEIGPSTNVAVGTDATVAGRTVYELVLTPKAANTLAESVSIAVDSETGLPLRVTVAAKAQDAPAFDIGFTSIDFGAQSADLFAFTPAAGVTVEEQKVPDAAELPGELPGDHGAMAHERPIVTGTGWDAIVEISAASVPAELAANPLVAELSTAVEGGRVLSTSLVNVFLADDGRVFAGSVPVALLQAAANAK